MLLWESLVCQEWRVSSWSWMHVTNIVLLCCVTYCRCLAIAFLAEKMPLKWILNHQQVIIMALMYVLLDLSNEVSFVVNFNLLHTYVHVVSYYYLQVSSGTVDQAKKLIDKILRQCNKPLMDDEQVSSVATYYIYTYADLYIHPLYVW